MRFVKDILITIFALGTCACVKVLDPEQGEGSSSAGYHVRIQAALAPGTRSVTFNGDEADSHFSASDKIYVYNVTQQAWARFADEDHELSYLQPTDISGRNCTLEGNLSFFSDDNDEWIEVQINELDRFDLFYRMNDPNYDWGPNFDYTLQKGSAASASNFDFGQAKGITMDVVGNTLTVPGGVVLSNLQSMFRQHLTLQKGEETITPSSLSALMIETTNKTLVDYMFPEEEDPDNIYTCGSVNIRNPEIVEGNVFLSLSFVYDIDDKKNDRLLFTAIDDEDNVYRGGKDVPTGGFLNGYYYYGAMEMQWCYQRVKPLVTRSDGGSTSELVPGVKGLFYFSDDSDPTEIRIEGNSAGYQFRLEADGIVTLAGNGEANIEGNNRFILGDYNLTIVLESDYAINCPSCETAIFADLGGLHLRTTGGVQRLTVTALINTTPQLANKRGLYGDDNYYSDTYCQPSALAADGFSVSLTSDIDNGDGTHTWVYTVIPDSFLETPVPGTGHGYEGWN